MVCPYSKNSIVRLACKNNGICYSDVLVRLIFGLKYTKWPIRSLPVKFHNHPMHGFVANCSGGVYWMVK